MISFTHPSTTPMSNRIAEKPALTRKCPLCEGHPFRATALDSLPCRKAFPSPLWFEIYSPSGTLRLVDVKKIEIKFKIKKEKVI